ASTNGSLKTAQNLFGGNKKLQIIKNNQNRGFSGGNNTGFEHSKGKYIVFLNNDTTVAPDWLIYLVEAMENDPTIGVAQSLIHTIDGKKIQTAGWLYGNYLIKKHQLFQDTPSNVEFEPIFEVSFVCGASMIIRRDILKAMGAFEPKIPFFYDDTLLSLKTLLSGKKVVTISASKIFHIGSATNVWKTRFTTYSLLRANMLLLFDVYYKKTDLAKALLSNLFYLGISSVFNLQKRNSAAVLGNLEALAWSLRNLRFLWQNRLIHWSKTKITPEELKEKFVRVNIPVAFYLFPTKLSHDHFTYVIRGHEKAMIKR
ncbi:MAG TPA: glycosyltransferase family 2 protein, partial [Candidatus Acidoferrales bacterium]|nr:glycosyltransferase family 2 protein [Candidatus Acidoferrales bacterium]